MYMKKKGGKSVKSVTEERSTDALLIRESLRKWQENLLANTVNICGQVTGYKDHKKAGVIARRGNTHPNHLKTLWSE